MSPLRRLCKCMISLAEKGQKSRLHRYSTSEALPWLILKVLLSRTPYSDISEGCILFGPLNSRFFIFNERLLMISHAVYLVSNKVASN